MEHRDLRHEKQVGTGSSDLSALTECYEAAVYHRNGVFLEMCGDLCGNIVWIFFDQKRFEALYS